MEFATTAQRICGGAAADIAISTDFGVTNLRLFRVWTDEIPESRAAELQARPRYLGQRIRAA